MSIQAVAWVLDASESRGLTRLVLISLANHANQDGLCWPAQRTIAHEAGIAVGTVSQAVQRLVDIGEVEVVESGGPRKSARYRLVHVVNAARAPGVNAARVPGRDRTIKNHQEPSSVHHVNKKTTASHVQRFDDDQTPRQPTGRFRGELRPIGSPPDCPLCLDTGWVEVEKGTVGECTHKDLTNVKAEG